MRKTLRAMLLATLSVGLFAATASAQDVAWPTRPIKIVVGSSPGGGGDVSARKLTDPLAAILGQPVIIENLPGGGGVLAIAQVAHAAPDGYTFVQTTAGIMAGQPALRNDLPYDVLRDFIPVNNTVDQADVLTASKKNVKATNLQEFIQEAKASPGKFSYGTPGVGTSNHIEMEFLQIKTGIKLLHVPFKSGPEAATALMGDQIDLAMNAATSIDAQIKAGSVIGLGVTSRERLSSLPNVPPIADVIPGYAFTSWSGIFAPAKTPQPIIDKFAKAIVTALQKPEIAARYTASGDRILGTTPAAFAEIVKQELKVWSDVVKAADIKVQ